MTIHVRQRAIKEDEDDDDDDNSHLYSIVLSVFKPLHINDLLVIFTPTL